MAGMVIRIFMGAAVLASALAASRVQAQDSVRPEVGKPLQVAQQLIRAHKFKEALAKVREADAVGGKTAIESTLIERMRMSAASGAGDVETATKAFETLAGSGKLSLGDRLTMIESLAGATYREGNYAKAVHWCQRYFKEGGTNPAIRTLWIQSQYLAGDFAGAARELTTEIQTAEKVGSTPGEDRLKLLLNATSKLNDSTGTGWALERLVTYYPKTEYWVDLLSRLRRKPHFSDRLALDVYRLSLATGSLATANDYMEMAQLALQAELPGEAQRVVDQGFAAGKLGTGTEAERHQRLRDLVAKRWSEEKNNPVDARALETKDGEALLHAGMKMVFSGDKPRGLRLMQQGLAKGHLKRPEDAKLHLGLAQWMAGENVQAQATLRTVGGSDGTADLARLWSLFVRISPRSS